MPEGTDHLARMGQPPQIVSQPERVIPFWRAPWDFAVHAIVGGAVFGIIAAAAGFISIGVTKLKALKIDPVIIYGIMGCEYALFGVDVTMFAVFLWRTAKRTIRQL